MKQVVYKTHPDGDLHELYVPKGGFWKHASLPPLNVGPPGVDLVAGYEWPKGGTKQVVYTAVYPISGDDRYTHIHELWCGGSGAWQSADLNFLASGPPQYRYSTGSGYAWDAGGTKQVVYATPNGHIHELYVPVGGDWWWADLTLLSGAPALPVYSWGFSFYHVVGYDWPEGGTKQVVYAGEKGHIHELYVAKGGSWQHADLIQLSGAPECKPSHICGFAWKAGGMKQVIYVSDSHIHELSVGKGGSWMHADLTALTNSPVVSNFPISAYSWDAGETKQVVYIGDGHIHELYVVKGGSWKHADLTALTGAPEPFVDLGALSAYAWNTGGTKQVVYGDSNGHIHELYIAKGGSWQHVDLTDLTHSPPMFFSR